MKLVKEIYFLVIILLITLNPSQAIGQSFFNTENPLVGKQAPDFILKTVNGNEVNMTELREEDSAIIFFLTTWCPNCREHLLEFNKQDFNSKNKGIKLILVDVGENAKQVRSYMNKNKIKFNVFLDQDSSVSEEYGIIGVPTFFFVNKDGIIKAVEHSIPDNYEEILQKK